MEWRTIVPDVHGIKCDTCSWRDDSVQFSEYEKYLKEDCPNCGMPLLTMTDYLTTKKILRRVFITNIIFAPIYILWVLAFKNNRKEKIHEVVMNGTGIVTIKEKGN